MAVNLDIQAFDDGSFIAEGTSYVYSYSAIGKAAVMSTKDGAYSFNVSPPYEDPQQALEFVEILEKSSHIKALQMSDGKTIDSMELIKNGDVAERDTEILMKETASIAMMAQIVEHDDMIRFAEKLCEETPLRGIDINKNENNEWCLDCSTLLGHEVGVSAKDGCSLLAATSEKLEELQKLTNTFMRVTKPPLITGPAEKIKMTSKALDPKDPEPALQNQQQMKVKSIFAQPQTLRLA